MVTDSIKGRSAQALAARREAVLNEILAGNGNVRSLSERLGVSEATIRRDLALLSEQGKTTRTYGGAVSAPGRFELSLNEKETLHQDRKEAIARRALTHVGDGDTLILDAGTTVGRFATHLSGLSNLRVITNGISSLLALANSSDVELVSLGGLLRHISQAFVGPLADVVLQHLSADVAFLGADGLGSFGLCCPTANHATLKSHMAARASRTFLLIDSSKFGRTSHQHWAPFQRDWTLITDSNITAAQADEARSWGLRLEIVPIDQPAVAPDSSTERLS